MEKNKSEKLNTIPRLLRVVQLVAFTLAEGVTHVGTSDKLRKSAFTLAEVLITLGIIGIVAALTIPTLVSNFQQKAWDTSAAVFEKRLEESLKVMNTQQVLAGYKTTEAFVNELSKHMKINNICSNDDLSKCMGDTLNRDVLFLKNNSDWTGMNDPTTQTEEISVADLKTAQSLGQEDWNTETIGVQFANGTNALIAYNPNCKEDPYANQYTGTGCVSVAYDTNGFSQPNTSGKDLRSINAKLGKCNFLSNNVCLGVPIMPTYLTKSECEERKSELGLNVCPVEKDYFAGAAAACGGANNIMPYAKTQAAQLKMYLYNYTASNATQTQVFKMDYSRAAQLGFNVQDPESIRVYGWRPQLADKNVAYYEIFPSTTTGSRGGEVSRSTPGLWTLCTIH